MKKKYIDLVDQTFEFPQTAFRTDKKGNLYFQDIPLVELVEKYGSPLKFNYLPKITENIGRARTWFGNAIKKLNYKGEYHYCYCTKSSHFSFVLDEVLKNKVFLETSSAYDIDIIKQLWADKKIDTNQTIVCNGFKLPIYIDRVVDLLEAGFNKVLVSIDNKEELFEICSRFDEEFNIGIRIAAEEEPKFEFYTARLGIGYKDIIDFYKDNIKDRPNVKLRMLHFFINTGIKDNAYYWNELSKCVAVYCALKKICPELTILNIGGGFPIQTSLNFHYDYEYMAEEILTQIKQMCKDEGVKEPHIFTEFGSFTVGESGGMICSVVGQKQQNDKEKWNIVNTSFMTNLPDTWAINQRFIMFPINNWNDEYERVLLGGITCDSEDYYNSEQHINAIYLPQFQKGKPMHIGFFHTGAYQESLGGYGGLQHCLIPNPKHLVITRNEKGELEVELFSPEQPSEDMLKILGYNKNVLEKSLNETKNEQRNRK